MYFLSLKHHNLVLLTVQGIKTLSDASYILSSITVVYHDGGGNLVSVTLSGIQSKSLPSSVRECYLEAQLSGDLAHGI